MEIREAPFGSPEQRASVELRRLVLRHPLGLDFTAEELASEGGDIHLVALSEERVVGCLVLSPLSTEEVKMRQVAVEPHLQGAGVGRALVAFSERLAAERGFRRMVLHARDTAVPFYLHLGYMLEGEPFVEVTIPHRRMSKRL